MIFINNLSLEVGVHNCFEKQENASGFFSCEFCEIFHIFFFYVTPSGDY